MKPITKEQCELMWVWSGDDENPMDKQRLVTVLYPDGSCEAMRVDDELRAMNTDYFAHCAPIKKEIAKKLVPCECKEDLPDGWMNGWIRYKGGRTNKSRQAKCVASMWLDEDRKPADDSW